MGTSIVSQSRSVHSSPSPSLLTLLPPLPLSLPSREQYIVGVDGKSIFLLLRALPVRLGDAILQARGTGKLVPAAVLARKQN